MKAKIFDLSYHDNPRTRSGWVTPEPGVIPPFTGEISIGHKYKLRDFISDEDLNSLDYSNPTIHGGQWAFSYDYSAIQGDQWNQEGAFFYGIGDHVIDGGINRDEYSSIGEDGQGKIITYTDSEYNTYALVESTLTKLRVWGDFGNDIQGNIWHKVDYENVVKCNGPIVLILDNNTNPELLRPFIECEVQ